MNSVNPPGEPAVFLMSATALRNATRSTTMLAVVRRLYLVVIEQRYELGLSEGRGMADAGLQVLHDSKLALELLGVVPACFDKIV